MPRDLDDLLAEGAPRDPGSPDLDAIESRAARRRTGRIGATVVGVLAAVAIAVQTWPTAPETPIIDEVDDGVVQDDGTTVLPLPAPGEVLPAHANGRPVFVVHAADGAVRVLDAIDPHDPYPDAMKVLAYCASSGWFEDPWHGSKFADSGAWMGGPAPYGLATHEVVEVGADTVTVGRLGSAPARGVLEGSEAVGPHCGGIGEPEEAQLDDIVLHVDATGTRVPGLLYPERPADCCGFLLPDEPQVPVAEDPVSIVLPGPDELFARHVGDRPAFLVPQTGDDGVVRVSVFDGINPHENFGPTVLTVCTEATVRGTAGRSPDPWGVVYDPWYLSEFSPVGRIVEVDGVQRSVPAGGWTGGPAPTGLSRFPVLEVQPGTGSSIEVTVLPGTLPPPPRVDLDLGVLDDGPDEPALDGLPDEGCNGRDQLFPDMPPADPTLLDDVILHEPLHPDLWWYPTPARLLGDEPGLPPEELQRYLEELADGRVLLDLDDLPSLGATGLAVDTAGGVELVELDGTSLGLLPGLGLADDGRDGHGGALLLQANLEEEAYWVAPSNGTWVAAEGLLVDAGVWTEQTDGSWTLGDPFLPDLPGPVFVGNGARHVTGPVCFGADDCPAPTVIDLDMGGERTTEPGCVATDGFADFNLLEVCGDVENSLVRGLFVDRDVEWRVPRYAGQPDEIPTIGRWRDAVFGNVGVVGQLSLECEVPAVVLLDDDGTVRDPWGGETWESTPTSALLGTVDGLEEGAPTPLVQVAAGGCGDVGDVAPGIWALTADGPTQLNGITQPVALWTDRVPDLDIAGEELAAQTGAETACAEDDPLVADADVDADGAPDRVVPFTTADSTAVLCTGDGEVRRFGLGPIEALSVIDIGLDGDAIAIGGTSVSSRFVEVYGWVGGTFGTLDRLPPCEDPEGCVTEDRDAFGLVDGLDPGGGSVDWGCLPARFETTASVLVTVQVTPVEGGEVAVHIERFDVDGLSATSFDESNGVLPEGGEFQARDILRDLGARIGCAPG